MIALKPLLGLYLQYAGGYYPVPLGAQVGLMVLPGSGCGVLVAGGKPYSFAAADPTAKVAAVNATPEDLVNVMASVLSPAPVVLTPQSDLSAAITKAGSLGTVMLTPGHYVGSYDFVVADDGTGPGQQSAVQ